MASTSFSLSNQLIGRKFSAPHLPDHHPLRFFASYATAERTSHNALQTASLYEVLGVQTGATCQEIKSAYRKLARVLHPDVASNAADEFMQVHAAYATLSDPEKRAVYDSSLFRQRRRAGGSSGSSRRTWETDQCW
ncbi:hypothetical protein Pfo_017070 [Paulownia fortunei]|nr:hypothetical protein Pfo_017070 [Paulownia fortunei]